MYLPKQFAVDEETTARLLATAVTADLVTFTERGLLATFVPVLPGKDAIRCHVARANEQWRVRCTGDALMILHGPDAYVSPAWYPATAEHGRVVPTWNYVLAHVHGRLVVHDDPAWVEEVVRALTDRHEATRPLPWSVDDAPPDFVAAQLRAVVGLEVVISRVDAKVKWSQNRPQPDRDAVTSVLGQPPLTFRPG